LHARKKSPRRKRPGGFCQKYHILEFEQEKVIMKPPQAWQAAIGQLQLEMPKAAFDTWVRDAEFLTWEDHSTGSGQVGTFTIGVRNAYAREWLADRLTSTIAKLLTGIMNQAVEVRFVVIDPQDEADIEEDDEIADVEAVFDLPYDEIVGTGIIAIPAYFGRYHLSELGPNLAWMVVGFRQAAYSAGRRSGARSLRVSERSIARWSGMYRSTFQRRKQKDVTWEKLQGFVNLVDTEPSWITVEGETPRKRAHAYKVQMTIPLTAAHACSLKQWLMKNIEAAGGPKAVLELAITVPKNVLLPDDATTPEGAIRKNVAQIVRECFAGQLPDEVLKPLAQRLHHHIMPPNDKIIITHFFVENLLPVLGPGPAWMLTLLRDHCFYDPETGEQRNVVTVPGGWSEIAGWMGLKRPMTIWRWLHGTKRKRKKGNEPKVPPLSIFVHEVETPERASSFNRGKRTFHVALEELPLTIMDELGDYSSDMDWRVTIKDIFARMRPTDTKSRECVQCNRANVSNEIARMRPDSRAFASNVVARSRPDDRANASNLSSLTPGLNHLSSRDITNLPTRDGDGENGSQPSDTSQVGRGGDSDFPWDWEFLFEYNPEINPEDRKILKERDATRFVAWLIYAYSKKGKGIDSPVMFAVRRVQQGRAEPAEVGMYWNYSVFDLHSFLTHYPTGGHWDAMLPQTAEKRAELKRRLCGPIS